MGFVSRSFGQLVACSHRQMISLEAFRLGFVSFGLDGKPSAQVATVVIYNLTPVAPLSPMWFC